MSVRYVRMVVPVLKATAACACRDILVSTVRQTLMNVKALSVRTEVFVRTELHPSLASVLVDFQGNYVNGNHLFVPIVLQERCV